jgi:thiamine biosynthesis lipoprotein ApbE
MANLSEIVKLLKKERDHAEKQLAGLNAAVAAFVAVYGGKPTRQRRRLSAKARAKIAAAQRARWAKVRAKRKRQS